MSFQPYLFFGGNCREAFTRYQEIFGGELVLLTMADMPSEEPPPSATADFIMHAALKVGDQLLMASDDPTTDDFGPVTGMMLYFGTAEPAEAQRVWDALAEGGTATMPMTPTSWSPLYGMCTDRFGTPWMVSAEPPA